jgi:hypothetical protein
MGFLCYPYAAVTNKWHASLNNLFSYFFQMAYNLLSEIHNDSHQWTICALVSRLWLYRGGTDEGTLKHVDLVLLDAEVRTTALALAACYGRWFKLLALYLLC